MNARRNARPVGADPAEFYRVMLRTRLFEELSMRLKREGQVLGNTYPCLGQEALGIAGLALAEDDAVFPHYRSRAIFFGKGVSARAQFAALAGGPGSPDGGREVFHHASFLEEKVMPASSMIGGWAPMAAGYALTQKLEGNGGVTLCCIGDGALGAGDLHEALNIVGTWKLPFVLLVENNGYQVSQSWRTMRAQQALEPYVAPYGFATRPVDGNDAFDMYRATEWARAEALAGRPAMLDCRTFRMGGYSSHLAVPRPGIETELADWQARDPIAALERWFAERGRAGEIEAIKREEAAGIEAAWADVAKSPRRAAPKGGH